MKVYVSYTDRDADLAARLAARLAAEGFGVWPDDQVLLGDNWALAAGKALEDADAMVVLLSPEGLNSERVRHEIGYALTQQRFQGRLFPVQVRPTKRVPWMQHAAPLIDWRAAPDRALVDIVMALRASARVPGKRRYAGAARARTVREPARVTG